MIPRIGDTEDRDWQRLDKWLWCARVMRARTDCAELVAQGSIRINRQATGKPHAKLRIGDVLTIPVHGRVRVLRVARLALRRGPASEARLLYVDTGDGDADVQVAVGRDAARRDASNRDAAGRDGRERDAPSRDVRDVSATSCAAADSAAYRGQ